MKPKLSKNQKRAKKVKAKNKSGVYTHINRMKRDDVAEKDE